MNTQTEPMPCAWHSRYMAECVFCNFANHLSTPPAQESAGDVRRLKPGPHKWCEVHQQAPPCTECDYETVPLTPQPKGKEPSHVSTSPAPTPRPQLEEVANQVCWDLSKQSDLHGAFPIILTALQSAVEAGERERLNTEYDLRQECLKWRGEATDLRHEYGVLTKENEGLKAECDNLTARLSKAAADMAQMRADHAAQLAKGGER